MTGEAEQDPLGAWRSVEPAIFALVDAIELQAGLAIDPAILRPVRDAVESILGPAGRRPGGPHAVLEPSGSVPPATVAACVDVAEQFVVDVPRTTDEQRAALSSAMGRDTFTFVQVLYVVDVFGRMRIGFDRLGPPDAVAAPVGAPIHVPEGDLWTLLERFMQVVAQLDALDPLTAELVRLRGARVHDCRLCRSRRSLRALDAAGDPDVLEVDDLDSPRLDERQRVALRATDALVTQPSAIDAELAAAVHRCFSTDEVLELVLDVARNAANKIAVALGADAPVVADGIELYDLDATGTVVADVDAAVVRAATTA